MNKNIFYVSIVLLLFVFPLISSNGLQIIGIQDFQINKTQSEIKNITIIIKNEQPDIFYNVSAENNPHLFLPNINQISSGSNISMIASIIGTSNFNGPIKIRGFYQSNLGKVYATHNVNISYQLGPMPCNFNVIESDTVRFNNFVNDPIVIRNADTGVDVASVSSNSSFTTVFDTPGPFRYNVYRQGFLFASVCSINVLDDQGLVNDPTLDTFINLNLSIVFNPTTIELTILNNNYTSDYLSPQQDILSIRNNGLNTAKNIFLESEWFTFTPNKFDLSPGVSKTVGYTIIPSGLTSTNQTNKTYIKTVSVSGNFPIITKDFNIFVNFADIDSGSFANIPSFIDLLTEYLSNSKILQSYCNEDSHKLETVCREFNSLKTIIISNSSGTFNFTQTQEQWDNFIRWNFEQSDINAARDAQLSERLLAIEINQNQTSNQTNETLNRLSRFQGSVDSLENASIVTYILITTIIVVGILIFIIIKKLRLRKLEGVSEY